MHFKTALSKKHLNIAPSKNAFQKNFSNLLPQKMYFKNTCQIAPSKKCISKFLSQRYFFINASINAVKNKADIDKSLMYGSILVIH